MLYALVLLVHILVSLVLVAVILIQGGRGGLSETMAGSTAQSLFGGRTSTVLTRMTTGCASIFMVTCLSLAYLSASRGPSIMEQMPLLPPETGLPTIPGVTPPAAAPVPVSAAPVGAQSSEVPVSVVPRPAGPAAAPESPSGAPAPSDTPSQ